MPGDTRPDPLADRLGHLFKRAHQRLAEASARTLAPFGVDGRELAVLVLLHARDPLSQQEAAGLLGVDRTTMVALVDTLEAKALVERQRSAQDRRRNTVRLTPAGQRLLRQAETARQEMERRFLGALSPTDADRFVAALRALATDEPT